MSTSPSLHVLNPEDEARVPAFVAKLMKAKYLGVDTETTGLHPVNDRVRLLQISDGENTLVCDLNLWRNGPPESGASRHIAWSLNPATQALQKCLESKIPKIFQNAAFDLNMLLYEGLRIGGEIFDTYIAAKIINNGGTGRNNLGAIAKRVLGVELPKELQKSNWAGELTNEMIEYAERDAFT